jgi:hypothetical protein
MTVIDQYIADNLDLSDESLAMRIGVQPYFVKYRKRILKRNQNDSIEIATDSRTEEMQALISLIETRKTGWAVDIARAILAKIQTIE